jgi:hypothetical protein
MKRWFNSDTRIIFNVVIALIVGIIFGNFLGSSMLKNESIYANAVNYADDVYVLQSGHYYDEYNANVALEELKKLGINGIVVREYSNYYVYHGIAVNTNTFTNITNTFEQNSITYLIKSKKLFYLLTDLDPKSESYEFYYKTINYYLSLINNNEVVLTDDYIDKYDLTNLDLYNSLNMLNEGLATENREMYKLFVYRDLVNLLL